MNNYGNNPPGAIFPEGYFIYYIAYFLPAYTPVNETLIKNMKQDILVLIGIKT